MIVLFVLVYVNHQGVLMKKTSRSLIGAILATAASAWALAASAATVYVPTQDHVPRSHMAVQTTDQPALGMASNAKDALTSKNQVDKMADTRTPDKVVASRMPATFQAMVRGEKRYIGVGEQVALVGSSPPLTWRLKQESSSRYVKFVDAAAVKKSIPQPLTPVGARSQVVTTT
jgi:hypothetical protein